MQPGQPQGGAAPTIGQRILNGLKAGGRSLAGMPPQQGPSGVMTPAPAVSVPAMPPAVARMPVAPNPAFNLRRMPFTPAPGTGFAPAAGPAGVMMPMGGPNPMTPAAPGSMPLTLRRPNPLTPAQQQISAENMGGGNPGY